MGLKITKTNRQIEREVTGLLSTEINKVLRKNNKKIVEKIRALVAEWIMTRPEVLSLLDEGVPGSLNAQFGFFPGQAAEFVDLVVRSVVDSIRIKVIPLDKNLKGGVEFNIQPSNYTNLLSSQFAVIITSSGPLFWLEWLLKEGTQTVVFGYKYVPDAYGRSGGGYMQKGGIWRIPPEYAGTTSSNFITRALVGKEKELSQVLREFAK